MSRAGDIPATATPQRVATSLREADERFDLLLRVTDQPIWEWVPGSRVLWFNETFLKSFGYEEVSTAAGAEFWRDQIHPEDRENALQRLRDFLDKGGETETLHFRFRRRNGTYAHVRDRLYVVRDKTGKVTRALGTMEDVTEQVHAAEKAEQIRNAIEFASDAICVTDEVGRSLFQNRTFAQLLGYDAEALNGFGGLASIFENRAIAEEALNSVRENGFWVGNAMVRTRSGQLIELFLRANAVRDEDQQSRAVIFSGMDVSEDRKAQRKIAEQAALLNEAQDAIVVQDLQGRIMYWNKGAERLFGWTPMEVIGQRVQTFLFRDEITYEDGMVEVLQHGSWITEITDLTKNGKEVLVQARWTLVRDERGRAKSILTISTDITEKKKLEAQFFRSQRLDSIGTLAGGIAHDLNNVFGPIIMAVDLFKMKMDQPPDRELLETVDVSARRGANMVRQVLAFARGSTIQRGTVSPRALLGEIAKIIQETFPKSITLHLSIPDETWNVSGDLTQLHQVVLNLAVNARDAMPTGGELTLSAENLPIDEVTAAKHPDAKPGAYVAITVSDTGTGMKADVLEKIFEPFFTTKDVGSGTGLGLSSTLSIVKGHGGFVAVESEPGKGSSFHVHLSADTEHSPTLEDDSGELPHGYGETVLVIDDEASVRLTARQTLEAFGYSVLLAANGSEGLETFARHKDEISAVLTDMMMPVMDGATAIREILRLDPAARIIAASGIATKETEAEAASYGEGCLFIPKPYNAGTLLRSVRKILDGEER